VVDKLIAVGNFGRTGDGIMWPPSLRLTAAHCSGSRAEKLHRLDYSDYNGG
jgi:hypothetical protein